MVKLGIPRSKSATLLVHFRAWLEETHSTGFELRRHFFFRFFDSEFISTPGQGRIVAGGVFAILASLSIIFSQAYYHKYLALNGLPDRTKYDLSVVDDVLLLITLSMFLIGLLTTIEWPCLFPGLRDYMAFASLPIRARDLFIAKFATMIAVAALFITGVNLPPSLMLPMMMSGRYGAHSCRGRNLLEKYHSGCASAILFPVRSYLVGEGACTGGGAFTAVFLISWSGVTRRSL